MLWGIGLETRRYRRRNTLEALRDTNAFIICLEASVIYFSNFATKLKHLIQFCKKYVDKILETVWIYMIRICTEKMS